MLYLTSTVTGWDIAYAGGWSLWRPLSFNMPCSDLFINFDLELSYLNMRCKNEIKDNNDKIWSRFSHTLFQKIDFRSYSLHRDHPPVWELIFKIDFKLYIGKTWSLWAKSPLSSFSDKTGVSSVFGCSRDFTIFSIKISSSFCSSSIKAWVSRITLFA